MCQGDEGVLTSRFFGPKTELEANDYIMSLELHLSDFEDMIQHVSYMAIPHLSEFDSSLFTEVYL